MPPVRISAQLQPQHADWPAMRRAWVEAEALGVDCLFDWDHFFPLRGDPDGLHFGGLKRTLKLVARHADIWHAFGSVDVFREKAAILEQHCAAEGRDPTTIERS